MLNKIMKLIFLVLFIITFLQSCDTTEPEKNGSLLLNAEEVSCTEAWLSLKATSNYLPEIVNVLQENKIVAQLSNFNGQDTIVHIDSLQPSSSYNFVAQAGNLKSNIAVATTMDTTSHFFSWETFTFGESGAGSSYLNDVAVIDENNIWAVGAIYMKDSLGNPDPNAYNAVHWNGTKWELRRIMFYTICGQQDKTSYPAKAIFALNESEIWIATDGNQLVLMTGQQQGEVKCLPSDKQMSINKIWLGSNNDLYAVGYGGKIIHKDGSNWVKIESGTELEIQHIFGIPNEREANQELFCVASDKYFGGGPAFFKIKNNKAMPESIEGLPWSVSSIWIANKYKYFIVGDGIYVKNINEKSWQNLGEDISPFYCHFIRGSAPNDFFVVGAFGEYIHFNGKTWYSYKDKELQGFVGNYVSVDYKMNTVCAVGHKNQASVKAVITLGRR